MSKRSQEKRRARAREKAKMARREHAMGPWARLTADERQIECWMQCAQENDRLIQLTALRPVYGGGFVLACFLVDFDCLGIKDAFARADVNPGEFLEHCRKESRELGARFFKTDLAQVRQIVAGAVRWASEQGFVLPRHIDRCLKILGISDVANADTSRFGAPDGGLHYIGLEGDLEARLGGVSVDEFLARDDAAATFLDDDFDDDGYDDDDFEQDGVEEPDSDEDDPLAKLQADVMELIALESDQLARDAEDWCRRTGRDVPELLPGGASLHLMTMFGEGKFDLEIDETGAQAAQELAERTAVATAHGPVQQDKLRRACQVIREYVATLPDEQRYQAGMSLEAAFTEVRERAGERLRELQRAAEPVTADYQRSMKEEIARWCLANGQPMHERIDDAIVFFLTSLLLVPESRRNGDAGPTRALKDTGSVLLALEPAASRAGILAALKQVASFMKSFSSADAFVKALDAHLPDHDRPRDLHIAAEEQ